MRDLRRFRILVKVADGAPDRVATATGVDRRSRRRPDLADLRDDALDNDLLDGVDFAIGGEPVARDECIVVRRGLRRSSCYRDAGVTSTLFASRSIAQARAVFLDEACWLGAERGRGSVRRSRRRPSAPRTGPSAQVVAAYERRLLEGP